jgi:hypothetical protein
MQCMQCIIRAGELLWWCMGTLQCRDLSTCSCTCCCCQVVCSACLCSHSGCGGTTEVGSTRCWRTHCRNAMRAQQEARLGRCGACCAGHPVC